MSQVKTMRRRAVAILDHRLGLKKSSQHVHIKLDVFINQFIRFMIMQNFSSIDNFRRFYDALISLQIFKFIKIVLSVRWFMINPLFIIVYLRIFICILIHM